MDWIECREGLKKHRLVLIAALIGILLMLLSDQPQRAQQPEEIIVKTQDLESELSCILSKVSGAGKVEVLLSLREGEQTIYQNDEIMNESDIRRDTVLVTDVDRKENGLIKQVNPPKYRGAIVVCQGADRAEVRLAIVEAVKSVTGLSSDLITVLKMK